jgi:hypothetical protein
MLAINNLSFQEVSSFWSFSDPELVLDLFKDMNFSESSKLSYSCPWEVLSFKGSKKHLAKIIKTIIGKNVVNVGRNS